MRPSIPEQGRSRDQLLEEMKGFFAADADWRGGRVFSLVYHLGEEHERFLSEAHALLAGWTFATPTAVAANYAFPLAADVTTPAIALVEQNVATQAALFSALNEYRTTLGLPEPLDGEAATVREPGLYAHGVELWNHPLHRRLPLPQANLFATARDYAAFLRAVLRGGVADDGTSIVAPETAAELTTNQGGALPGGVESFQTWPVCDWGCGFELRDGKSPHWTGDALGPRAATHFGAAGTLCAVDPDLGIGIVLLANRGTYAGWMLRDGGWPAIVAEIAGM